MYLKLLFILISIDLVWCAMEGYVMGGNQAKIKTYPHSVLLNIVCDTSFICGGSILNQHLVLTAAHCLEDCHKDKSSLIIINIGHEDIYHMTGTKAKDFEMHPRYDDAIMANDIGLVLTEKPLRLGVSSKRVALMRHPDQVKAGYMAGWGVMNKKGQSSDILLATVQQLQTQKVCSVLGSMPLGTFCAGPVNGPGAPDEGDSGSALVAKNYIQLGLVSYKIETYSLVVYTNVSYHYVWIQRTAQRMFCRNRKLRTG